MTVNLRNDAYSSPRRHRLLAAFILAVAVLGALRLIGIYLRGDGQMEKYRNPICRDRYTESSANRCRVFPIMATVFTGILIISACGGGSISSSAGSTSNPAATAGASGSFGSTEVDSGSPPAPGSGSPPAPGSGSPPAPGSGSPPASSPSPSSTAGTSYYLADFNPVQTYGINIDSTPHTVNGVIYDHPVAWSPGFSGNPYWAEWDLSRQCTWLTSPGVGLADDAPSGATAIFSVQTDGSYKWQKTIRLGQSDNLKVLIKGALRLRLSVADVQNSVGNSYETWGDAEVWCSSQPPNSTNGNS